MVAVYSIKIVTARVYLCILLLSMTLVSACTNKPDAKKAIIGQWVTSIGEVMGLGNVTQTMEFFDNGTVTSRTDITNFIGDYQFLDDDTIRIDWKEQGLFGHSPTQIFDVYPDNNVLITVNDTNKQIQLYLNRNQGQEAYESFINAITTELPTKILGIWIPFSCNEEQAQIVAEQYSIEFLRDGKVSSANTSNPAVQGEYSIQSNILTVNNVAYEVLYLSDNRIIVSTGSQDNKVNECWYKM